MVETASYTSTEQKYVLMATEPISSSSSYFHGIKPLILLGIVSLAFFPAEVLAKFVFNLLATLPMAYFSLKILMRGRVSEDGLKSVVFYWLIYGVFLLLDAICSNSFGYKLFKSSVLLFIAYHVTQSNLDVFGEITGYEQTVSMHHPVVSRTSSFDSRSPTFKDLNTTVSTHYSIFSSDLRSSQERSFPFTSSDNEIDVSTAVSRSRNRRNRSSQKQTKSELTQLTDSVVEVEDGLAPNVPESLECSSLLVECSSTVVIGDIVDDTVDTIELIPNVPHLVTVVNCSSQNIMWALKSNVLEYLSASPVCGVILSGATAAITLIRHESASSRSETGDRLAIDYALVGSVREYSPSFLERTDKKRHAWTVKCKSE